MSGTPTIIPKVTRSRDSWRTSLTATARRRRSAAVNRRGRSGILSGTGIAILARELVFSGRHDEHVFQAGLRVRKGGRDAVLPEQRAQRATGIGLAAVREHAQAHAELRHAVHPGQFANEPRCLAA